MSLIKLTDKDGKEIWINPIHVRSVAPKSGVFGASKGTEIMLGGMGSMHGGLSYTVPGDPEQIAALVSDALLQFMPLLPPPDDDRHSGGN